MEYLIQSNDNVFDFEVFCVTDMCGIRCISLQCPQLSCGIQCVCNAGAVAVE